MTELMSPATVTDSPAPEIGWNADWGMAASIPEKDYYSLLQSTLQTSIPDLEMMRENVYPFERNFDELDFEAYDHLRNFQADLLVIRIGENVSTDMLDGWNFSERLQAFAEYLTGGPDARVIVTTTFWENSLINEQLLNAAHEKGWETVELSHLGHDEQNMAIDEYENEAVARHPNDTGMEAIATLLEARILKKE
jgi:hypothetical protein